MDVANVNVEAHFTMALHYQQIWSGDVIGTETLSSLGLFTQVLEPPVL